VITSAAGEQDRSRIYHFFSSIVADVNVVTVEASVT